MFKADVVATSCFDRNSDIEVVALQNEKLYVTVLNKSNRIQKINIKCGNRLIKDKIERNSVITYVVELFKS